MTLAALVVGVSVLLCIRGLLNGLQHALVSGVTQTQTGALQVHKKGYLTNVLSSPLGLNMPTSLIQVVEKVPGVTAVTGRITFAGMVSREDASLFTSVQAFDPNTELKVCPMRTQLLDPGGAFVGGSGRPDDGVLLTGALARSIQMKVGDEAAFLSPDIDGALSGENIQLVGTVFLPIPGEKQIAMAPLQLAQRLLKMEGKVTELAVSVDDLDDVKSIAQRVQAAVGPDYEVHTWDAVAMFVRQATGRQDVVIAVIAAGFLLLMLLGVANTMLMSMLERTREIGTMMALGVRQRSIMILFLLEALCIGGSGGTLGAIVGSIVVHFWGQRGIRVEAPGSHVPFDIIPTLTLPYVLGVLGAATVGSAVFALYPAWRASRLRPVQALAGQ